MYECFVYLSVYLSIAGKGNRWGDQYMGGLKKKFLRQGIYFTEEGSQYKSRKLKK